jgi:hypothetical protein
MRGLFYICVIALLVTDHVYAAENVILTPHRAIYNLELKEASQRSGISAITGRMVYDFNGSSCEGYTTTFRYMTKVKTQDNERVIDQQTTTFETGDAKEFEFLTKNFVDQSLDKEIRGTATDTNQKMQVNIKNPNSSSYTLESALFPTTHLQDLLTRAHQGERLYQANIFDGSADADHILSTTVIIGEKSKLSPYGTHKSIAEKLRNTEYYPVSIAYFDPGAVKGDDSPIYQTGFKLYENGITSDVSMSYGDFSITGTLVDLKILTSSNCDKN